MSVTKLSCNFNPGTFFDLKPFLGLNNFALNNLLIVVVNQMVCRTASFARNKFAEISIL